MGAASKAASASADATSAVDGIAHHVWRHVSGRPPRRGGVVRTASNTARLVLRLVGEHPASIAARAGRNVGEAGGVNPGVASCGSAGAAFPPKAGDASRSSSRGDANGVHWLSVADYVSASDGLAASGLWRLICARAWTARWRRCLVSSRGPGLVASPIGEGATEWSLNIGSRA